MTGWRKRQIAQKVARVAQINDPIKNEFVWPFPPPGGPVPWTPAQKRAYQDRQRQNAEDAPL